MAIIESYPEGMCRTFVSSKTFCVALLSAVRHVFWFFFNHILTVLTQGNWLHPPMFNCLDFKLHGLRGPIPSMMQKTLFF